MGKVTERRDRINAFKNELKSYRQLKRDYRHLTEQLLEVNQKMFGFGGPTYDGMPPRQYNPFAPNPLTVLGERKAYLDDQLKIVIGRITNVDNVLNTIDDPMRKDLVKIYVYGHNIEEIAMDHNTTHRMQRYYMDQAIYEALQSVGSQWMDGKFDSVC